jgi:CsoR family transcriptional regulator, copper-sensing transcriptional repressor
MPKEQILTRLRKVEGQVRGLQRMISEDRDCEAILTQLMAARAALDKTALSIAGEHLDFCVDGLIDQPDSRIRILRTMELFLKLSPSGGEMEVCEPTVESE